MPDKSTQQPQSHTPAIADPYEGFEPVVVVTRGKAISGMPEDLAIKELKLLDSRGLLKGVSAADLNDTYRPVFNKNTGEIVERVKPAISMAVRGVHDQLMQRRAAVVSAYFAAPENQAALKAEEAKIAAASDAAKAAREEAFRKANTAKVLATAETVVKTAPQPATNGVAH